MISSVNNGTLEIGVKHFGAVLTSVKSEKTGYQFLWQGNPEIWNGQSPILFPVIGRLLDDKFILNGKEYSVIRHGIARHNDFELFSQSSNELTFVQRESEETLKSYPFKYELFVSFSVDGNKLTVTHTVKNTNDGTMYFCIGAHPAFNCEIGDTVEFDSDETAYCERIDSDSILIDSKDLILNNSNTIKILPDTFSKDAMIFSGLKSKSVILNKHDGKKVKFTFGDAPFFAVWAKPNAPFVCLEPWYGINDSYEKVSDISRKRGIVDLEPHKDFSFSWSAEFIEE